MIDKLLCLFFLSVSLNASETEIYIGIEKKSFEETPKIAFFNFLSSSAPNMMADIKEIVRADIMFSGYLNVVEFEQKIEDSSEFIEKNKISYPYFLSINGELKNGIIEVEANIYNIPNRVKNTKKYTAPLSYLRRLSHFISDDVIEKTVNKKFIASSRIAFANNSTGYKEIYMIDYDGENLIRLTDWKSISIVPRWSADGKRIYYTTYRYGNPDIAYIEPETGLSKIFSKFQGLNIPGSFTPDGSQFAVILSKGKDPSVYILNLLTKEVKNIVDNFGVCASPTFSPDGKEIAFVSDRPGRPQLYIYNLQTKNFRKLTGFYWVDSPSWSPDGKWIAFSGRETKYEKLNIFLIDPTTSVIKRLTRNEGDNEDPSFSPDSRYIAFISTRNGSRQLFVMDVDGSRPHLLSKKITGNCYTPNWSKN